MYSFFDIPIFLLQLTPAQKQLKLNKNNLDKENQFKLNFVI